MDRTKYDKTDHQRAWELWYNKGLSYSEIAEKPKMPSYNTVKRWAKGEVDCDCPFHHYRQKRAQIRSEAQEEVKDELDLPDEVEREKNQLKLIYQTQKQIEELLKSGNLETPKDVESAVKLLKELNDEERLIKGESTEITEMRGADHNELNLQKVMKQLVNVGDADVTEDEFIEEVEESLIQGEDYGQPES